MNNDNVSPIASTPSTLTTAERVSGLLKSREAASARAQRGALEYMSDMDAQEKQLRAKYKRGVQKALEAGDTVALGKLVEQAIDLGVL